MKGHSLVAVGLQAQSVSHTSKAHPRAQTHTHIHTLEDNGDNNYAFATPERGTAPPCWRIWRRRKAAKRRETNPNMQEEGNATHT